MLLESLLSLKGILILLVCLIAYFLLKQLIIPYQKVKFYKNQGAEMNFIPFTGALLANRANVEKYGDFWYEAKKQAQEKRKIRFIAMNIGSSPLIYVVDPELLREFYKRNDYYHKSALINDGMKVVVRTGLVALEGSQWKSHRKLISSKFHFEFIKLHIPTIVDVAKEIFDRMELKSMERVAIREEFSAITGFMIGRIFFGENVSKYNVDGDSLPKVLEALINQIGLASKEPIRILFGAKIWHMMPKVKRLMARLTKFREVCSSIIQDRRQIYKENNSYEADQTRKKDLLDFMLELQLSKVEDAMSDEDIVNNFITFFAAGMDTTSHTLTIMLYHLYQNSNYLDSLRKEIDQHYKEKGKDVTSDDLNLMEFTGHCIKETLRITPPTYSVFIREAICDHNLGDVKVKKGTLVGTGSLWNNYNPNYHDDPERFNPNRWNDAKYKSMDGFVFIPFSGGPKNCIGQHFAQIAIKLIISQFLIRYDFRISEGYVHKMTLRFLNEPLNPVLVDLKKNNN